MFRAALPHEKPRGFRRAFTLIELLVVISIIGLLVSILVPTLARARGLAREAKCLSNVHAQLVAVHMYASNEDGRLPTGTDHPLLYQGQGPQPPISSSATFQFWLGLNQEYAGLGVLWQGKLLPFEAMFCPDDLITDMESERNAAMTKSANNAWCSYLYRQLDGQASPTSGQLDNLGYNAQQGRVRVLVLDMQCTMVWTGLPLRRNHSGARCAIGIVEGGGKMFTNDDERFTLNGPTGNTYQRLDEILETADALFH